MSSANSGRAVEQKRISSLARSWVATHLAGRDWRACAELMPSRQCYFDQLQSHPLLQWSLPCVLAVCYKCFGLAILRRIVAQSCRHPAEQKNTCWLFLPSQGPKPSKPQSPRLLEPPSASLLEATPGGEEEEFVSESLRRTADRAQDRQVLELDALILPFPRRAHGADFPLHSLQSTGCTSTGSKQASRMSPAIWADLEEQERLLQELGRAGYIQKRIHRKLHAQAAQIGDRELLSLGDLCFSKQFAEVERLAGRASTNDFFQ